MVGCPFESLDSVMGASENVRPQCSRKKRFPEVKKESERPMRGRRVVDICRITRRRSHLDLDADPCGAGVSNFLTYGFFGAERDPATVRLSDLPQVIITSDKLGFEFTLSANVEGVHYSVEWNSSLNQNGWQTLPDQDEEVAGFRFDLPIDGGGKLLRLKVIEN